jgi:hypothetical protein
VWDLLNNFCIGNFSDKDLKDLLFASGLSLYAGCLNVIYDSKGNLYEIPNYCIHPPSEWDIPKFKIKKPENMNVQVKIRYGIEEFNISLSNQTKVIDLKSGIVKNLKIETEGELTPNRIRLFHHGKELLDKDCIYMHEITTGSNILMMIKKE